MRQHRLQSGRRDEGDGLDVRVVQTNKVSKTHKGGKTMSWSVLVVVGDGNGKVGAAIGKALGIPDAIRKGEEGAKRSMSKVPMLGKTIPHMIIGKEGSTEVLLRPASPGTGVVAGGNVRAILESVGIKDILTKSLGSSNPFNVVYATMEALESLRSKETVAKLRNKDVSEI